MEFSAEKMYFNEYVRTESCYLTFNMIVFLNSALSFGKYLQGPDSFYPPDKQQQGLNSSPVSQFNFNFRVGEGRLYFKLNWAGSPSWNKTGRGVARCFGYEAWPGPGSRRGQPARVYLKPLCSLTSGWGEQNNKMNEWSESQVRQ